MKLDTSALVNSCKDETTTYTYSHSPLLFVFPGWRERQRKRKDTCGQAQQKMVEDKNCRRWSKRRGKWLPRRWLEPWEAFSSDYFIKKPSPIIALTSHYPLADENGYSLNISWWLTCERLRMVTKVWFDSTSEVNVGDCIRVVRKKLPF